jgi:hypothetical protein
MRAHVAVFVGGLGLLLASVPALAHHSFAVEFDAKIPLKLTGVVTRVEWKNPHAYFYIDVTDKTGTVTNWGFELTSPNVLMRQGWSRNSLKLGDTVSVEGSGAKDGSHAGNTTLVVLSTGQRLFGGTSQPSTP